MPTKNSGNLPYHDAIRELFRLINMPHYDEGGWLPSAVDLSQMFNVNRLTCLKALKFLKNEGVVRSFPKKGYYVAPKLLRIKKIALILENGCGRKLKNVGRGSSKLSYSGHILPLCFRGCNNF